MKKTEAEKLAHSIKMKEVWAKRKAVPVIFITDMCDIEKVVRRVMDELEKNPKVFIERAV